MTYTGYARRRGSGFQSAAQSRRVRQIESNLASQQNDSKLAAQIRKENQKASLDAMRSQFKLDQDTRQDLYEIEVEQASIRRNLATQIYDSEIRNIEAESAQQKAIFESISGLSTTASEYLKKEAEERKDLEIKTGEGLIIKYGLTPNEIADLEELSLANKAFGDNTNDVVNKLREMGAPESDIQILRSMSGWTKEGAVRKSILEATSDYSGYLSRQANKEFLVGDQLISLAKAERDQSPEAQQLALDLLRTEFIEEYLPGISPEYIARHGRDNLNTTEAQRKVALDQEYEKTAAALNNISEQDEIINIVKSNLPNAEQSIYELFQGSPFQRARVNGQVAQLVKSGAISSEFAQQYLNGFVQDKRFPEPVRFSEANPALAADVRAAIDAQEQDRRQARNRDLSDKRLQVRAFIAEYETKARDLALQGDPVTEAEAQEAIQLIRDIDPTNIEAIRTIQSMVTTYSPKAVNTRMFEERWNESLAVGIVPTIREIKTAGLSPEAERKWMKLSAESENSGLTKDRLELFEKSATSALTQRLGARYNDKAQRKPPTFVYALDYAKKQYVQDYKAKFLETNDAAAAEQYAIGNFNKELQLGDNGKYRIDNANNLNSTQQKLLQSGGVTAILDPTFKEFEVAPTNLTAGQAPRFFSESIPEILKNPTLVREKAYVSSDVLEAYINRINNNEYAAMPPAISKIAIATKRGFFEVLQDQIDVARRTNPNLPELQFDPNKETTLNQGISPELKNILDRHRYDPRIIDRVSVSATGGPVYDQDDPYYSVTSLLSTFGVTDREDLIKWAAIMMGESSGRPAPPDYRGADPTRPTEKSRGLYQINLDSPGRYELLEQLGVTPQQLYDPVKNITVALEIYRQQGFGAWGAYTNGSYEKFIPEATRAVDRFLNSQSVPTYERTQNINDRALRLSINIPEYRSRTGTAMGMPLGTRIN